MSRGVFVSGTDTGVGKTFASCEIARRLSASGLDVGVMKPMETGVGEAGPLDAISLRDAADCDDPIDEICPIQLPLPAAPNVAAAQVGSAVELDRVYSHFARLAARHDVMVVEGAGGLLVPTTDQATMADLAAALELPVVFVARASLGTINHTRLTLAEAERRGLEVAGVVVSHSAGPISHADRCNLDFLLGELHAALGARLLGEILPVAAGDSIPADALDLSALIERLS
jgi:dethiobiotin synthetase